MNVTRGDVVLANYPFADLSGSKVRPALVVQCDRNNRRLHNTLIVQITSRIQPAQSEPTQVLLSTNSAEGRQAGLLTDSAVSCENIFTVPQNVIRLKIGRMPSKLMAQINEALQASPELK